MKTNKLLLRSLGILMLVMAFMLVNNKAKADHFQWGGPGGITPSFQDPWSTAGDWYDAEAGMSTGALPGPMDDVEIFNTGSSVPPNTTGSGGDGYWDAPYTIASLTIDGGATLYNDGSSQLTVTGDVTIASGGYLDAAIGTQGGGFGGGTPDLVIGGNVTGAGYLYLCGDHQLIQLAGNLSVTNLNPHYLHDASGGSTIEYNGSGNQTISYYILDKVFVDIGSKLICTNGISVNGALTVNGELYPGSTSSVSGNAGGGSLTGTGTIDITQTGGTDDFASQYIQTGSNKLNPVTLGGLTMNFIGNANQFLTSSAAPTAFLINTTSGGAVTFSNGQTPNVTIATGSIFIVAAGSTFGGHLIGTGTIVVTDVTSVVDNLTTQYTSNTAGSPNIDPGLTIEYAGTTGPQQLTSIFNPANFIIANTTHPVTFSVSEAPTTGTTVLAGAELIVSNGNTLSGTLTGPGSGFGIVDVMDITNDGHTDNLKNQYIGGLTLTNLTFKYAATGGHPQFIYTAETFGGLDIENASGVTAEVSITVGATFTVGASSSFTPLNSSINIDGAHSGTITGTGTLNVNATGNSDDFTTQYSNFTYSLATSTENFDGTSQNINTSVNFGNVILHDGSGGVTGAGTINIAGSVTNPGGTFNFTAASVNFDGGTLITQSVIPMTVTHLTVAGSGSSLTVNLGTGTSTGGMTINTGSGAHPAAVYMGGALTSSAAVEIDANGTLITNGSNTLNITSGGISGSGTLDCAAGGGGSPTVDVVGDWTLHGFTQGTNSTVVFKTNGAQALNTSGTQITFDNMTVGDGVAATTLTVGVNSVEVDDLLTGGGGTGSVLNLGNAGTAANELLALYGDVTNPSGNFVINQGSGRSGGGVVAFLGNQVSHTTQNCDKFTFFDVYIDNTESGGNVLLGGDVTINDNLDFASGNIVIGTHNLTLASGASHVGQYSVSPPTGNVFTANITVDRFKITNAYDGSHGYVIQNDGFSGGYLIQPVDNSTGYFFPVGDDYAPIQLTGSGAATQTSVRVSSSLVDNNGGNVLTHAVKLTWDVNPVASQTFTAITQWGQTTDELGSFDRTHTYLSYRLIDQTSAHPWVPFTPTAGTAATAAGTSNGFSGGGAGNQWSFSSGANATTTFAAGTDNFIATGDDASALPVSLLTFAAQYEDGHVNLNWSTASEQNNAYFDIERSTDANNWTSIGQVQGHGTSNVLNSYLDIDNLQGVIPTGTLYYRLKQVDFNGAFEYSMIRSVDLSNPGPALAMYPNPTSNTLNVNWTSATDDNAVLRMINMSGVSVYTQSVSGKGVIQKQIDMSTLPSGVYYLQVISSNGSVVSEAVNKN